MTRTVITRKTIARTQSQLVPRNRAARQRWRPTPSATSAGSRRWRSRSAPSASSWVRAPVTSCGGRRRPRRGGTGSISTGVEGVAAQQPPDRQPDAPHAVRDARSRSGRTRCTTDRTGNGPAGRAYPPTVRDDRPRQHRAPVTWSEAQIVPPGSTGSRVISSPPATGRFAAAGRRRAARGRSPRPGPAPAAVRTPGRRGQRPHHQVGTGGQRGQPVADQVPQPAPHLVADHRRPDRLRTRRTRPGDERSQPGPRLRPARSSGWPRWQVRPRPHRGRRVDRRARRRRTPRPAAGAARPPARCSPRRSAQADRRSRPLARRADRMARPARVRMRSRKPWVFARRRLFGWYVRLLTVEAFRACVRCGPLSRRRRPDRWWLASKPASPQHRGRTATRQRVPGTGTGRPDQPATGAATPTHRQAGRHPRELGRRHCNPGRTAVEPVWTSLLACPVAGSRRGAGFVAQTGKTGPGTHSFATVGPPAHRRQRDHAAGQTDTQAVDNLWTVRGRGRTVAASGSYGDRAGSRPRAPAGVGEADRGGAAAVTEPVDLRRGVERRDRRSSTTRSCRRSSAPTSG